MVSDEFGKNKAPFWKARGFYLVVALCVVAAGAGVWGAMYTTGISPEAGETTTAPTKIDWNNQSVTVEEEVNNPVTNVPDRRDETETAEPTLSKAQQDALPYTGNFTLPFGTSILKDFSHGEMVKSKTMNDWRVHNGVDFSGEGGNAVLSIQAGTVTAVYDDALWGTVVAIDHDNGMTAKYCGLAAGSTPSVGKAVKKSEPIGKLGFIPVEAADDSHLHLEITIHEETVDPLAAMNRLGNAE